MLIETRVVRSESELLNDIQRMSIAKAVVCCNVDMKPWEQITKEHQEAKLVVTIL